VYKAHQRANAIHRCFESRNVELLLRAYTVYVRPLLKHNTVIWSPHLKYNIQCESKNTPLRFSGIVPKRLGIFLNTFSHTYYTSNLTWHNFVTVRDN